MFKRLTLIFEMVGLIGLATYSLLKYKLEIVDKYIPQLSIWICFFYQPQ